MLAFVVQTLAGLPDQDSYYDMVDCLEEQAIEATAHRHISRKGTDLDLVEQFNIYEVRKTSPKSLVDFFHMEFIQSASHCCLLSTR